MEWESGKASTLAAIVSLYRCIYVCIDRWQSQHKADVYEILSQVFGAVDLRHVSFRVRGSSRETAAIAK